MIPDWQRLQRVGFWRDPDDPRTDDLPDPHDMVDPAWDPAERAAVIDYLRKAQRGPSAMGYSWCRFRCGIPKNQMGAADFHDDVYAWPEGYPHYLEAHGVKPPEEFLRHVRSQLERREH